LGVTAILPFSLRAREKPSVALPISWNELKKGVTPNQFEIFEVRKMLKKRKDSWANYWNHSQKISVLSIKK